jgi:hypothetical protein
MGLLRGAFCFIEDDVSTIMEIAGGLHLVSRLPP